MIATYGLNLAELTTTQKWILLSVVGIIVILGIIDYFYQKNKKNDKN